MPYRPPSSPPPLLPPPPYPFPFPRALAVLRRGTWGGQGASLYVRGARLDGVPLGHWVPITVVPAGSTASGLKLPWDLGYLPDTVLGEVFSLAALAPAAVCLLALVEEARFRLNVTRLNREAGL